MCRYLTGKTVGPWCFLMVPVRCRLHQSTEQFLDVILQTGWSARVTPPRGPRKKRGLFATRAPHRPPLA